MVDLSILVPSRNEMFLAKTVEDLLAHIEGNTEILVGLDGAPADPPVPEDPRVKIVYHETSIGQRAITNELARMSEAKYLMKVDAHCAFDQGFDVKMMADMQDDWVLVPTMRNLHAFDLICVGCGARRYQGPTLNHAHDENKKRITVPVKCPTCNGTEYKREIVWDPKKSPQSNAYRFDKDMHFQYWAELANKQKGDLIETLSIQGSCFMCTRKMYFDLDLCSETFHSWGQQGVEVACKTWLSGGKVMVTKKTWYAHMFRTQGGDFSFPYPQPQELVEENRELSRKLFMENTWPKAVHPFSWLLEKFWPVPGWDSIPGSNYTPPPYTGHNSLNLWRFIHRGHYYESLVSGVTKGVVYYTHNKCDPKVWTQCQQQLDRAFKGKIVSISWLPIEFGENIVQSCEGDPAMLSITKAVLRGLENINTDIVFLCEHDVLYHPSHFDFTPPRKDVFYYNINSWHLRAEDGHCLYFEHKALSQLCAYRELLLEHFRKKLKVILDMGDKATHANLSNIGYEPGSHNRPERIDDYTSEYFKSTFPNIDIRHGSNTTRNRWSQDEFRDKSTCQNWQESDEIPFWGKGVNIIK